MPWPTGLMTAMQHLRSPISAACLGVPDIPLLPTAKIDHSALQAHIRQLLVLLGQNPDEPGLLETPRRVADMWLEFLEYDPGRLGTVFEAVSVDQMVVVKGMPVWSLCAHHLLPFGCDVAIGYIAANHVLGLSKLGRIAEKHAHRLQLQERLVQDIAIEVQELARTDDVAVIASGTHLCMAMRGVRMPHRMVSSAMFGRFRADPAVRAEFMALAAT